MADVKVCNKCNAVFPDTRDNWQAYIAHHNAHIRGELPALPPVAKKEKLIDLKINEDIRNVKLDEPAQPGASPPALPALPQNMMPQQTYQPPIYYPQEGFQPQYPPQQPPLPQPPALPPESQPISLKYVYEGTCPQDNSKVMTVETDVENNHYVMAICPTCQRQWQSRKVVDLNKEEVNRIAVQNKEGKGRVQSNKPKRNKSKKNIKSKSKKTSEVIAGDKTRVEAGKKVI